MEGNFRIVQTAESEFIIQKEVKKMINKPVYLFKIPIWVKTVEGSTWQNVDKHGFIITLFNMHRPDPAIYADVDSAIRRINYIKEFPKVVYPEMQEYENNIFPKNTNPHRPQVLRSPKE